MCGAWLCHSWIFGLGIELLILCLLVGFGAFVNALIGRIWGETGEETLTTDRSPTAEEQTINRAA
jgi:Na+-transporting methylmalonyl-CoA/oxaloacetate decarboxylase gamma subunit